MKYQPEWAFFTLWRGSFLAFRLANWRGQRRSGTPRGNKVMSLFAPRIFHLSTCKIIEWNFYHSKWRLGLLCNLALLCSIRILHFGTYRRLPIKDVAMWPVFVLYPCMTRLVTASISLYRPSVSDHLTRVPLTLAWMCDLLGMPSA